MPRITGGHHNTLGIQQGDDRPVIFGTKVAENALTLVLEAEDQTQHTHRFASVSGANPPGVNQGRPAGPQIGRLERSPTAWRPYLWPIKLVMLIGFTLMLLQALSAFIRDIATIRGETI